MRGLLLSIGEGAWAVRLEQVHEVIASPALTSIPGSPPSLLGVCNRRGDVLPVLSLPAVLGSGSPTAAERSASWVAVVSTRDGPAGIAVTSLPEVVELGSLDGTPVGGGQSIALLDLDAVLTPARVAGHP